MRRTQLALVIVGVLALVGGGTALAGMGGGHSHGVNFAVDGRAAHGPGDDLDAAASYLGLTTANLLAQLQSGKTLSQVADATSGKSTAGLVAALVAHEKQELADAVAAGRLTKAQADQIGSMLTARFNDFVTHSGRGPFGGGRPHHAVGLEAAAAYLGTTESALLTQLRAGKTLAQIADATSGKSASGLIDALVADATQRFGTNVPPDLRARITDLVNGTLPAIGPCGRHGHWLPGAGRRL
jgi:hypothetical protein